MPKSKCSKGQRAKRKNIRNFARKRAQINRLGHNPDNKMMPAFRRAWLMSWGHFKPMFIDRITGKAFDRRFVFNPNQLSARERFNARPA